MRRARSDTGSDVMRRWCGHVSGSRRAWWLVGCWLMLLMLVLSPVVSVEHHTWHWPPRLEVKVFPRHSVLAASQSVTIQCSVRSILHAHRSRLRVAFYVCITHH